MEIKTGWLYCLKDEFYEKVNDSSILPNKGEGHGRPTYLTIKEDDILWFIPLSLQVDKYQKQIDYKVKKYGSCDNILIRDIAGEKSAILIQNAFPTLEKYVDSFYIRNDRPVKVIGSLKQEILDKFSKTRLLKQKGIPVMWTDIVKLEELMRKELEEDNK